MAGKERASFGVDPLTAYDWLHHLSLREMTVDELWGFFGTSSRDAAKKILQRVTKLAEHAGIRIKSRREVVFRQNDDGKQCARMVIAHYSVAGYGWRPQFDACFPPCPIEFEVDEVAA